MLLLPELELPELELPELELPELELPELELELELPLLGASVVAAGVSVVLPQPENRARTKITANTSASIRFMVCLLFLFLAFE